MMTTMFVLRLINSGNFIKTKLFCIFIRLYTHLPPHLKSQIVNYENRVSGHTVFILFWSVYKPLFVNNTISRLSCVYCFLLLATVSKGRLFHHAPEYLKSCKHPFLKNASLDLWYKTLFCCFDLSSRRKSSFWYQWHTYAQNCLFYLFLALHTCHFAFYDSTLVTVYFPSCIFSP